MKTVTLGGQSVQLQAPASIQTAYDVVIAAGPKKNSQRAMNAALGLCWESDDKPSADFEESYNPLKYGGEVFDELVSRGLSPAEISAAASVAWDLVLDLIPDMEKVDAAEGNSESQEEPTSS